MFSEIVFFFFIKYHKYINRVHCNLFSVNHRGIWSLTTFSVDSDLDTVTNTEGHHQTLKNLQGPLHKSSSATPLIHSGLSSLCGPTLCFKDKEKEKTVKRVDISV